MHTSAPNHAASTEDAGDQDSQQFWQQLLQAPAPHGIFAAAESSTDLKEAHTGLYYPVTEAKIAEAFERWYKNRAQHEGKTQAVEGGGAVRPLPKFVSGCVGLQYEFEMSRYPYVMHRCRAIALQTPA